MVRQAHDGSGAGHALHEHDDSVQLMAGLPAEDAITAAEAAQQALEAGKEEDGGSRRPAFPASGAGAGGAVQSADASRTLRSSLAGSFADGDGIRCNKAFLVVQNSACLCSSRKQLGAACLLMQAEAQACFLIRGKPTRR